MARVLVTDVEHRSVIAAVRALGRAGFEVTTTSSTKIAPGLYSRFSSHRALLPDARTAPERFVTALEKLLRERSHDVVLPGSEASLLAIAGERERLEEHARTGVPPLEVIERSLEKSVLVEAAGAHGIGPPEGIVCPDDEAVRAAAGGFGFPVMVKPHRSLVPAGDGIRHEPAEIVEDEQGLGATTELFGFPVIVQRLEPDAPVHSLAGVAVEGGRLVGVAFAGYARTWPPLAGNASAAGTLDPPPELLEAVEATLRELGWQGIFELELLRLADGRFAAIDFNPRVYGSLALAVRAGANLPAIWCDVLLGRGPSEPVVAAPGYRYRLEDAELRNFVRMLRQAHPGAALALALPRRRVAHAYFRWDDPGPFVLHAVELALNGRASKLRVG